MAIKVREMDVFKYLEAEHQRIKQQLDEFIASYNQMSDPKRFERSSLIFDELKSHFEHETNLVSRISNDDKDTVFLKECLSDRENIVDAMDFLLMSHVDDVDYKQGLGELLLRFDAHLAHYKDRPFVAFREQLSLQELRTLDSQATDWMLGSSFGSRF